MYVFLDAEFVPPTDDSPPALLSIGLCTFGDEEFYAQVLPIADGAGANEFLREHVLAQFSGRLGVRGDAASVAGELAAWLDHLGDPIVEVCYDYHVDFDLFEQLLSLAARPLDTEVWATHVGYLLGDCDADQAAESTWAAFEAERGLRRHHALADSYALRARFEQVHGR